MNFEAKMKRLEEIVELMETSKKPLDEMIALFKEGVALSKDCKKELSRIEKEVQKVIAAEDDGTPVTEDMDLSND